MEQIISETTAVDFEKLIEHFSKHKAYKWSAREIIQELEQFAHNRSLVEYFRNSRQYVWYHDEIVAELQTLTSISL